MVEEDISATISPRAAGRAVPQPAPKKGLPPAPTQISDGKSNALSLAVEEDAPGGPVEARPPATAGMTKGAPCTDAGAADQRKQRGKVRRAGARLASMSGHDILGYDAHS